MMASDRSAKIREQLVGAQRDKLIVQFSRSFEPGTLEGYVMGVGLKVFLLASLGDDFGFAQYSCIRIADVRRLDCPARYADFYKRLRRLRGDKMPPRVRVDLTNISSFIDSQTQSLLTIHREQTSPDTCEIGYAISRSNDVVEFLEIGPGAIWDSEPTYLRLNQITRIDLPGPYERALLLVGGQPRINYGLLKDGLR